MTSDRPYRKALSAGEAIDELKRCAATQFDPEIVKTFIDIQMADQRRAASPQAAVST